MMFLHKQLFLLAQLLCPQREGDIVPVGRVLACEKTRGVVASPEEGSLSLQLTYAEPLCGDLEQG